MFSGMWLVQMTTAWAWTMQTEQDHFETVLVTSSSRVKVYGSEAVAAWLGPSISGYKGHPSTPNVYEPLFTLTRRV